LRSPVI